MVKLDSLAWLSSNTNRPVKKSPPVIQPDSSSRPTIRLPCFGVTVLREKTNKFLGTSSFFFFKSDYSWFVVVIGLASSGNWFFLLFVQARRAGEASIYFSQFFCDQLQIRGRKVFTRGQRQNKMFET